MKCLGASEESDILFLMCKYLKQSAAGFTLVELMVVIAIAGILMTLAAPSFVTMTQRYRAIGETSAFVGDLQYARSEAIKTGNPVSLCISSDAATCKTDSKWHEGWIVFADPNGNRTVDTTKILRIQKPFAGTDTFTSSDTTNWITYTRDGFTSGLPASPVTFTLKASTASKFSTRCVTIIKTGRHETLAGKTSTGCT